MDECDDLGAMRLENDGDLRTVALHVVNGCSLRELFNKADVANRKAEKAQCERERILRWRGANGGVRGGESELD